VKVHVLTEHVEWEGYSIVGVYFTEEGARNEVWKYVKANLEYNEEDGNVVRTVGFHESVPIFVEDGSRLTHKDGVEQWYRITAYEVQYYSPRNL